MASRTIEELANHDGHVLNLVEDGERVLFECITCQEVVLLCGEDKKTGELSILREDEAL